MYLCLPVKLRRKNLTEWFAPFCSGRLAPLSSPARPTTIVLDGEVTSQPFIDLTVALMARFGVTVGRPDARTYVVPQKRYSSPEVWKRARDFHVSSNDVSHTSTRKHTHAHTHARTHARTHTTTHTYTHRPLSSPRQIFTVEADATTATYFLACAAITGGRVEARGVGAASLQGDRAFERVLAAMGCAVEQADTSTSVAGPVGELNAVDMDFNAIGDTFMTAAVLMAAAAPGTRSFIRNIANQRVKECDRIAAVACGLRSLGVSVTEHPDGLEIVGCGRAHQPYPAIISCHGDHRMAMAFGVLGAVWPHVAVDDRFCVAKTNPGFWAALRAHLGLATVAAHPPPQPLHPRCL